MAGAPYEAAAQRDLTGYPIEALDGGIGKVDNANNETGASWLIVHTGPWIFRKDGHAAGRYGRPDRQRHKVVHVNRTKDEIKNAPELVDDYQEQTYRDSLGGYYGHGGRGYRE